MQNNKKKKSKLVVQKSIYVIFFSLFLQSVHLA